MSEQEIKQDQAIPTTPVETSTPTSVSQPAEAQPDYKAKLEELEAKEKRHKEQLNGYKKLIDDMKAQKIVDAIQPEETPTPAVVEDSYQDTPKPQKPVKATPSFTEVQNTIFLNELQMERKYSNDSRIPWDSTIREKVIKELENLDPTGRVKLSPVAWEKAYKMVRGDMIDEIVTKETKVVHDQYQKKEQEKLKSHVEDTTPPSDVPVGPKLEDVLTGKVKMTTKEMVQTFPELKSTFSKKTLKALGID